MTFHVRLDYRYYSIVRGKCSTTVKISSPSPYTGTSLLFPVDRGPYAVNEREEGRNGAAQRFAPRRIGPRRRREHNPRPVAAGSNRPRRNRRGREMMDFFQSKSPGSPPTQNYRCIVSGIIVRTVISIVILETTWFFFFFFWHGVSSNRAGPRCGPTGRPGVPETPTTWGRVP